MNNRGSGVGLETDSTGCDVNGTLTLLLVDASARADQHATQLDRVADRVLTEETVEGALAILSSTAIDCIVSEYELPDGDGIALLESVRTEHPSLPFVLWTDAGSESVASEAIAAGVTEYVPRGSTDPPEYDLVGGRIRNAMAKHRTQPAVEHTDATLQLFSNLCHGLAEVETVADSFQTVLEAVCAFTDWEYGEVWMPSSTDDYLSCVTTFGIDGRFDPFIKITETITFQPGEGLPGRVWSSGSGEWIPDVADVPVDSYLRTAAAEQVNLSSTFAVPIRSEDSIAGVVAFYLTDGHTADSQQRAIVETVAGTFETFFEVEYSTPFQRQRDQFRAVFEESFDAMVIADDAGQYVDVNESAATLFGCPKDELIGRTIDEFAPEEFDFENAWDKFQASNDEVGTFPLVRADGMERVVEYAATTDIVPGRHLSVLRDVTEWRRLENELKEVFERVSDAFHGLDTDWRFTYLNERAEELLGGTQAELQGAYVWDEFPNAKEMAFKPQYERAMETQTPVTFEEYSHAADAWLEVRAYPSETGLSIYFRDISERKTNELERELFRTLVDHSSDGFFVIDPATSDILDVNETACEQLGYDRDELLALSVPDINPDFSIHMWDDFVNSLRDRGELSIEGVHRGKDGSTRPVEISVAHVFIDKNNQEYNVATVRDISERKERERELEEARQRYQKLIEAAPDPIFVAEATTGKIVETNTAGARLRKQPPDEIVGLHHSALHPDEDADRYRELFASSIRKRRTVSQFEDGSPIYLATATDERIPVSISSGTVSMDDRLLIYGIFRDISDQLRYETALEGVNSVARELLHAETDAEIANAVTDIAETMVESTGNAIYLYDDRTGELAPAAYSDSLETVLGKLPRFAPGDGVAWQAFTDQELVRYDDVRTADDVFNAGTPIRSELIVPLGAHGVFIAGDTAVGSIDDLTVEIVQILAATAAAALDRAERTQELRERERESKLQTQRLERVHQLNEELRTIARSLVQEGSRETIKQVVCESLISLRQFDCAWIGEPDPETGNIDVTATAGCPDWSPPTLSLEVAEETSPPSVRATRHRSTVVESNIAASPHQSEWQNSALLHGFRSAISVPLLHEDVLYGVLTIYSGQAENFDELSTTVLTELGLLIGYALNTIDQRNALLDDGVLDLTFQLVGADDVFVELASALDTEIRIENITARSANSFLVHFVAETEDPERILEVARNVLAIESIRVVSESDPALFEAITIGECIATVIAGLGAHPRSIVITEEKCQLDVSVSRDRDTETFVRYLAEQYPGVELMAQQTSRSTHATLGMRLLTEQLTDRQRDILSTAYYSGYFDQRRKLTGTEIADSLDISQPAFSKQLRVAQAKLLTAIYGEY